MTTEATTRHQLEDEFTSEHHVYEPHKVGLPPMGSYVRELWRRREFAFELARTNLRAQHFNTVFGQLWLVINPLLLAGVYFVLVDILRSGSRGDEFFAHLMAGLFAYYFVQQSLQQGVRSVVSGGRLILNTAFPRALLPISSVITAFIRFLPTILIYIPVHIIIGLPVGPELLWLIPIMADPHRLRHRDDDARRRRARSTSATSRASCPTPRGSGCTRRRSSTTPTRSPSATTGSSPSTRSRRSSPPGAPCSTPASAPRARRHAASASAWAVGVFVARRVFFTSREREFAVRL